MADTVTKIISVDLQATSAIEGIVRLNDAMAANTKQIEANNQAIAQNNQAMRQSGADTTALARKNDELKRSNAELSVKQKELSAEKRVLQKEVQNEIKMQTEEVGSLKSLRAELSNLTKQYDSLSRAERENANVGGRLKEQINQVTTEIKTAEEGTQRYYRNVGNYQNAILNALGLNNKFANSLISLSGAEKGVSGAFTSMGASAKAFGASLMALLTNPVFLALAGIAGVGIAFKWFYDYNEGLAEATRLTREFTGYTGDNLTIMRDSIRATSDVMGKDFKETLQSVDTVMANFHVDGKTALDIINKGFAAGADINGDYLQQLKQYAPTFHDAGIAADEMVAIITQTRSGIFSEQGLEAIKQGSARIREMSNTTSKALEGIGIDAEDMGKKLREGTMSTFDAVKQVSAAMKQLPDNSKEVGEAMTAVFGRQGKFASQEMIESLAEMSTSLDEVTAKTGEYGDQLLENIETEEELNEATAAIFDMTQKGWEEAKNAAIIYAKKALVAVVRGCIDVINWFIKLYNESLVVRTGVQGIVLAFKNMWAASKFVFRFLLNGFKNVGNLISAFVHSFAIAGQTIKGIAEGLAKIFKGIFTLDADLIKEGAAAVGGSISNGAQSIVNAFQKPFSQGIADLKAEWSDFTSEVVDNTKQAVAAINGTLDEVHMPTWAGGDGEPTGGTATGGGSKGGTSGGGKGGGNSSKAKKSPQEIALENFNKRAEALVKKGQELQRKALEEESKTSLDAIDRLAEMQKEEFFKVYGDREQYEGEALAAWDAMWLEIEDKRQKAVDAYYDNLKKQEKAKADELAKESKALAENILAGTKEGTEAQMRWRLQILQMQMDAELAELEANEAAKNERREWYEQMRTAIAEKYAKQRTDIEQEYAAKQQEIQDAKYQAAAAVAGSMGEIVAAVGEDNKEAVAVSKMLALAEIMISQAVAIANAIKAGSNAINPIQMVAQIAASVTAVVTAMAQAFKALNAAKFATGGYVEGAGTSTSDSIPVRVSNGESIMNANTTAMFGGLLSSLNQLGGGVPIQARETAATVSGEDMLARAFARGVAMLPNPVVSVVDINQGQRQVEVINERATL